MDLLAYAQIELLEELPKYNNIEVPRLRGLRWMKHESKIELDKNFINDIKTDCFKDLLAAEPFFDPNATVFCYDETVQYNYNNHIIKIPNPDYTPDNFDPEFLESVDWTKIHGRYRKILKRVSMYKLNKAKKQFDTFNKYVGREDVLCIHTRIGGSNFAFYNGFDLIKNDWWLEKVDDYFDNTYCDIYAKINIPEGFEQKVMEVLNNSQEE